MVAEPFQVIDKSVFVRSCLRIIQAKSNDHFLDELRFIADKSRKKSRETWNFFICISLNQADQGGAIQPSAKAASKPYIHTHSAFDGNCEFILELLNGQCVADIGLGFLVAIPIALDVESGLPEFQPQKMSGGGRKYPRKNLWCCRQRFQCGPGPNSSIKAVD